jgi:signal transduction histidine kinase
MGIGVAIVGWLVAGGMALAVLVLRRRLELVADAAHELRGPVVAFAYAVAWLRREPGGLRRALRLEAELERMRTGLADLDAARQGERRPARTRTVALEPVIDRAAAGWRAAVAGADRGVTVRWEAGAARVSADRPRLSQAFGNLLANAVEHGSGPIEIHAVRRDSRAVRIEVRDGDPAALPGRGSGVSRGGRGRGLGIAERAIREAGGSFALDRRRTATVATVDLPLVEEAASTSGEAAR